MGFITVATAVVVAIRHNFKRRGSVVSLSLIFLTTLNEKILFIIPFTTANSSIRVE